MRHILSPVQEWGSHRRPEWGQKYSTVGVVTPFGDKNVGPMAGYVWRAEVMATTVLPLKRCETAFHFLFGVGRHVTTVQGNTVWCVVELGSRSLLSWLAHMCLVWCNHIVWEQLPLSSGQFWPVMQSWAFLNQFPKPYWHFKESCKMCQTVCSGFCFQLHLGHDISGTNVTKQWPS